MRVLIVGSGIAGLSAAIALRKVGCEVAVYERAPELREVGAGISLWANALRALDYIGAGAAVRAVALPMARSEMRTKNGLRVLATFPAAAFEKTFGIAPFVAMTHRADLVGALAAQLPAGVARYGVECVGVEQDDRGATVRFKNGHADTAALVVGADGLNSAVRAALF
ncbi:MAG TPA: FAD-dependent monooxygenase, partial [Urbifossiella sp.]|nr:FAD-dependent monooxygenase [Urbifossiella sp.]